MYPTIKTNFTILLRAGAFSICDRKLQPMSHFKWHRLLVIAKRLNVDSYISSGIKMLATDEALPKDIQSESGSNTFHTNNFRLYNKFTNKRLSKIVDDEYHSIDTSVESIELLKLLVANADEIITSDLSLNGVIAIGLFLRTKGDKVDFVKLSQWINHLGLKEISSLLCSLLINLFDFEQDELEFMTRKYYNPLKHYDNLLETAMNENHSFSVLSRLNVAMFESLSYNFGNLTTKILDVEE